MSWVYRRGGWIAYIIVAADRAIEGRAGLAEKKLRSTVNLLQVGYKGISVPYPALHTGTSYRRNFFLCIEVNSPRSPVFAEDWKTLLTLVPDYSRIFFDLTPIAGAIIEYSFNQRTNFRIDLKEFLHMRTKGLSIMGRYIFYRPRIQDYPLPGKTKHTCLMAPIPLSSWLSVLSSRSLACLWLNSYNAS